MRRDLAVLSALAATGCWAAEAAPPEPAPATDLHGATPMDQQRRRIGGLVVVDEPSVPPRWVDPALWQALIPDDNQPTAARIALGRELYFDPRLSADGTVACATCHDVTKGFTDARPTSEGIGDQLGRRNAPTTLNAALLGSQFWDGRAVRLEDQALLPIINSIEMGQPDGDAAVAAIAGDARYQRAFEDAYGRGPNYQDIGRAIAAFERTLIFLDAPFDRWARGEQGAISFDARAGWALFNGKARCVTCHPLNITRPMGTDDRFHNIGVAARHQRFDALAAQAVRALATTDSVALVDELALDSDSSELGRFLVTRSYADVGAFRTSPLRNVGITAPYMHDGSQTTLWDVMDHYNKGGEINPHLDGGIEPLALTEDEIDQVVAFLFTLTDDRFADRNAAARDDQRARADTHRPLRDDELAMRRRFARPSPVQQQGSPP